MSTHNICFRLEIRKILCGYPLLSVVMNGAKLKGLQLPFIPLNLTTPTFANSMDLDQIATEQVI